MYVCIQFKVERDLVVFTYVCIYMYILCVCRVYPCVFILRSVIGKLTNYEGSGGKGHKEERGEGEGEKERVV